MHDLRENTDNQSVNHLLVVKEFKEQMKKEENFLVFNFPDHKEAHKTDTKSIKELIICYSNLDLPFNRHTIRTSRVGKFKNDNCRPLVVYLKNKEHVHWFFKNKKDIFDDDIHLSSDLTKSQRDYYNIVNNERKNA